MDGGVHTKTVFELGFVAGSATPSNFVCGERELRVTVHGDDFTATGPMDSLQWLEKGLAAAWEIKVRVLGAQLRRLQDRGPRAEQTPAMGRNMRGVCTGSAPR